MVEYQLRLTQIMVWVAIIPTLQNVNKWHPTSQTTFWVKRRKLTKENHHMHCFYIETTKLFGLLWVKKEKVRENGKRYTTTLEANRESEWYTYIIPQFIFIHEFVRWSPMEINGLEYNLCFIKMVSQYLVYFNSIKLSIYLHIRR